MTDLEDETPNNHHLRKSLLLLTAIIGTIAILWFLLWWFYFSLYEHTDDAYSNGSMINITSTIEGNVTAFYADDTDLVEAGQLLIELDRTPYQLAYDKSLAALEAQTLYVRQLADSVKSHEADVGIRKSYLSKAQFDFKNRAQLVDSQAISKEDFVHSRDDLTIAEHALKKAEYDLKVSQDLLGAEPLEKHPTLEEKKAAVREAYYRLKHTSIYAPVKGYIAKRAVNVGQSVQRTSNLMAIIPTDYVWVDANFKETQLSDMRIGQPATVWFDYYGSKAKSEGKVLGIGMGSGSVFSLIPPQNATGNWIKIVQRLPVRIELDPEFIKQYPIRVGLSAEVSVDITNQDLPMLASTPPSKPVTTTDVFDVNFDAVDRLIDKIVSANLDQSNR